LVRRPTAAEKPDNPRRGETQFHKLLAQLGVEIDPDLLDLALTHRSYSYEHGQIPHNERLEFLGDSVLGVVVTEYLYRSFPDFPEGRLAKLRAAVVSAVSLGEVARDLGLGALVKLGKGEQATHGDDKTSILADTMEAVIGAAFLTGEAGAKVFVSSLFEPLVDHAATLGAGLDWKTSLQELSSSLDHPAPNYIITDSGPDHDKHFTAAVEIDGRVFAPGEGHNKKQAEQQAAENAFRVLTAEAEPAE
jgi:ribonuclease-3